VIDTVKKEQIEKQYGVTLTDNQYKTILWEIEIKEDDEDDDDDVIADVLDDLEWHEQDYMWWQKRLSELSPDNK
jgi:hypothetical protein